MLLRWNTKKANRKNKAVRRKSSSGRSERNFSPSMEALEDRNLLSVSIPLNPDSWVPIGPAPTLQGQSPGRGAVTGRLTDLAIDDTDATGNTVFVTVAGGGLWKTTNAKSATATWNALTDFQSTLVVGSVAVHPTNPLIIYAGTGESNNSLDSYYGRGLLKSTDGGTNWTLITGNAAPLTNVFNRREISKVVIDPTDLTGNTVYVALTNQGFNGLTGNTGVWKTTDGGTNWTDTTSGPVGKIFTSNSSEDITDLIMDPTDNLHLYAAVGTYFGGATNGLYETNNGGNTWVIAGNFPRGAGNEGRIAVAISKSNPAVLYASISSPPPPIGSGGLSQLLKSTNSGALWTQVSGAVPNYMGFQGWYDMTIAIDPSNPNIVYAGGAGDPTATGSQIVMTTDGGKNFVDISNVAPNIEGPHADHHAIGFDKTGKLLAGTDGGIWRLESNVPGNIVWANLNGNLQITTITGIALHPTSPNIAYLGSQDNGTQKFTDSIGPGPAWNLSNLGDGGIVRVDPVNPNTVYSERFGISLFRSDNAGASWTLKTTGIGGNPNFYVPYVIDPTLNTRLLLGTTNLYESLTQGDAWLARGTAGVNGFNVNNRPIDAIAIAPSATATVYVTAGGDIYKTTTNGTNWTQINVPAVADHFADIQVDPFNANTVYIVRDRFDGSLTGPFRHVYRSTNGGTSWVDISGNLPDVPMRALAIDTRSAPDTLYVGTDTGVFFTTNNGVTWAKYRNGLPNVNVTDLELNATTNILAAGTYGRGMWEIDLSSRILGQKFNDLNGNGTKDVGEPGLQNWTVNLLDSTFNFIRSTLTDVSGNYSFTGLNTGTYNVQEVVQAGWQKTLPSTAGYTIGLGIGQSSLARDFGNFRQFTISGTKFGDVNGNGVMEGGETGLSGWTIFLDANNNGKLDLGETKTTTNASGVYSFTNLGPSPSAPYRVREVLQAGWVKTTPDAKLDVTATSGVNQTSVNIGNFNGYTISGTKFNDLNNNGKRDTGEPGLQNWNFDLFDAGNVLQQTVATNVNGDFTFSGVGFGTFHVREQLQSGWTQTTANPPDITTSFGGSTTGLLFGNFQLIILGGKKFDDVNGDGVFQAGEPGLANWTIQLQDTGGNVLDTRTTDSKGAYSFSLTTPGTYRIREVGKAGWLQTTANPADIPSVSGTNNNTIDFGNFQFGSVAGKKFNDLNGDGKQQAGELGLAGWIINLVDAKNNVVDTKTTNGSGDYTFSNVGPGAYTIQEITQLGWSQTTSAIGFTATSGANLTGQNIGNFQQISINGRVFQDTNGNQVQDPGEPGLANWQVDLRNTSNVVLQQFTTGATGNYVFNNVGPGTYRVREIVQAGWVQTTPTPPDIIATSGANQTINFGNFRSITISGAKFNDTNGNGQRDTGEPGLANWNIKLFDSTSTEVGSATTDSKGNYALANVGPGTYTVREVAQTGWLQTTVDPAAITAVFATDVANIDFGNFQVFSITGAVFSDSNGDGVQQPGDLGLANRTVFLDANNNGALDVGETKTTTGVGGAYAFNGQGPGIYRVRQVLPAGWTQTTANIDFNGASGKNVANALLGSFQAISVSGQKFWDQNNNGVKDTGEPGLANWTIFLDRDNNNSLSGAEVSTQTDANGNFMFTNVTPGTYAVREVVQSGWTQTTLNPPAFSAASGANVTGVVFGNFLQNTISGDVFNDLNGDGVRQSGEPGVAGFTVFIDVNGNGIFEPGENTAISQSAGTYSFTNLGPGTYSVRQLTRAGWVQTSANPAAISATTGTNTARVDFGNFRPSNFTGQAFRDNNRNGVRDAGEIALPNWVIELNFADSGRVALTTSTDANGNYAFFNVSPGTYQIREQRRAGFSLTTPPDGGAYIVTSTSGENRGNLNFGNTTFDVLVTGTDAGGGPNIVVIDATSQQAKFNFFAYDAGFTGGVRVAAGDITGDGFPDIITAPGPGGGPDIHVYDGVTGQLIRQFFAYDPRFTGGAFVSAGDVNNDGFEDIVVGADAGGGPNVVVFSGRDNSTLRNFFAYDPRFTGGVHVAAGDTNGDQFADIVCGAGAGGGPNVTIFSGLDGSMLQSFFAYDIRFSAGIFVAAGDTNGDGRADVISGPGFGGGADVRVFDGSTAAVFANFQAYDLGPQSGLNSSDTIWQSGIRVAAVDFDNNGIADVVVGPGRGRRPLIRALTPITAVEVDSFFAYDPAYLGGVFIGGGH